MQEGYFVEAGAVNGVLDSNSLVYLFFLFFLFSFFGTHWYINFKPQTNQTSIFSRSKKHKLNITDEIDVNLDLKKLSKIQIDENFSPQLFELRYNWTGLLVEANPANFPTL